VATPPEVPTLKRQRADDESPSSADAGGDPLGLRRFPIPQTVESREAGLLGPWAMHSADSRGRKYPESGHSYRGPFQRDRDRIVHSAAYRRLSAKTQVFTGDLGDYHRTRLTHTLEVSSVARTLGRALALNEDLVEALALVHDLGHPPFGHAGEDILDECLANVGGFSHNEHALRLVEEIEIRYSDFPGLNLSLEVLDGQSTRVAKDGSLPSPLLEVQAVEAADSVAYDTHDADDALELGLLTLDELLEVPLWAEAAARVRRRSAAVTGDHLRRAVLHELIDWQVGDLLANAQAELSQGNVLSTDQVRQTPLIIQASTGLAQQKAELEVFLRERVYRHPDVVRQRNVVQQYLREMFAAFRVKPELLPPRFHGRIEKVGLDRAVGDYLAGMTDRFAQREYERLFASSTGTAS
jgi:dGTPase